MKTALPKNRNFTSNPTLLQLSNIELQEEIQQQLEINPVLDLAANDEIEPHENHELEDGFYDLQWSHLYAEHSLKPFNETLSDELFFETDLSLQEQLRWQLYLTQLNDKEMAIGFTIIDAIDQNGYLTMPLKDLYEPLLRSFKSLTFQICEMVRHLIQQFDPIGCASVTLKETLTTQLQQFPENSRYGSLAKQFIEHHLEEVSIKNYPGLMEHYAISKSVLMKVMALIRHLNPQPGSLFRFHKEEPLVADLVLSKYKRQWQVHLNQNILPKLVINHDYALSMKKQLKPTDHQYLQNHLQSAQCLLKNIENRQETLVKIAQYLIQKQVQYFDYQSDRIHPIHVNDMAQDLHLSVAELSQITKQTYIHTPRGLFELNYFCKSESQ